MKMSRESSKERLLHIATAIKKIETYTAGISESDFIDNQMINDAVLYQFTIIGEAIINVENDVLDKHAYPWHEVRAFRNLIAHQYFGIRLDKVWSIVQNDLPELKKTIKHIINNEF